MFFEFPEQDISTRVTPFLSRVISEMFSNGVPVMYLIVHFLMEQLAQDTQLSRLEFVQNLSHFKSVILFRDIYPFLRVLLS